MLNIFKFLKKNDDEKEAKKNIQDQFRRKLIDLSGFSDNTFSQLIDPLMPCVIKHDIIDKMTLVLTAVASDESLYRSGRKQAFYIAFCLVLTDAIVKNRDPEFILDGEQIFIELVTVSVFHTLLCRSLEGYCWINSSRALLKDAWLFLKAKKGRFAAVMIIPHDELQGCSDDLLLDNDDGDVDADDEFTEDTELEIGSLLLDDAAPLSDLDILNSFGAEDSSGPEFSDNKSSDVDIENENATTNSGFIDVNLFLDKK